MARRGQKAGALEVSRDPYVVTDRVVRLISRANLLLERARADVQAAGRLAGPEPAKGSGRTESHGAKSNAPRRFGRRNCRQARSHRFAGSTAFLFSRMRIARQSYRRRPETTYRRSIISALAEEGGRGPRRLAHVRLGAFEQKIGAGNQADDAVCHDIRSQSRRGVSRAQADRPRKESRSELGNDLEKADATSGFQDR